MSHGQNEQHEGWNGLIAMIATDVADSPEIDIPGEAFPLSQVYKGAREGKRENQATPQAFAWTDVSMKRI